MQILAAVFRVTGGIMICIGVVTLFLQIYMAVTYKAGTDVSPSFIVVGWGFGMIFGGIVDVAAAELVKLLVSMEQSQQMIVNELRSLRVENNA